MVPSFSVKCTEYLEDYLDPSNVFTVLPSAQRYGEENLGGKMIESYRWAYRGSIEIGCVRAIESSLLEELVERDTLAVQEIELFKGMMEWVARSFGNQGIKLDVDGKKMRSIIGERIIKAIRFPVMQLTKFTSEVLNSKVLTLHEVSTAIKCIASVQKSPLTRRCGPRFPAMKRSRSSVTLELLEFI